MKRILLLMFAAIGLVVVIIFSGAYFVFSLMVHPESTEFNAEGIFQSPNKEYKAILYTGMGGGAAGWCNEVVTIQPMQANSDDATWKYKVFSANCGSYTDVRWINESLLQIKFSIKGRSGGSSLYLNGSDYTGKVKIEYDIIK